MLDFSKNYFQLLGLPVSYPVDQATLSERYRALQQVVHPDRFANSSEQEKRLSMQSAILINEAYETLKSPLARAGYLLSLHQVDVTAGSGNQDVAFLMEQIELREQLESVRSKAEPFAAIAVLMEDIDGRIGSQVEQLSTLFEQPDEKKLEQARDIYSKMQFLSKLQQDAESLEEELEDSL
jgi:molecular chaperone HscB